MSDQTPRKDATAKPVFTDRAHGVIRLTGSDRAAFLHNMTTADIKGLPVGTGTPAAIVNQRGALLDWVDVYAGADELWLFTGPGRQAADLAWLERYLITEDVTLDALADTTVLYLTGTGASELFAALAPEAATLGPFSHLQLASLSAHAFATHGIGGAGFSLLVATADREAVEEKLAKHGGRLVLPEELEAGRIASGLPAHDREIVETRNPWEARLDGSVSLDKGCYLGQEIVARLNAYDKVQRYLVGLRWHEPARPSVGMALWEGDREVGALTSLSGSVGLGYVKAAQAQPGTRLELRGGAQAVEVLVEDRPFWAGKTRQVSFAGSLAAAAQPEPGQGS